MNFEEITLETLNKNVEGWTEKRLKNTTYEKQIEYYFSERAELFTTDDAEDAYGDMMVCLINADIFLTNRVPYRGMESHLMSQVEIAIIDLNMPQAMIALETEIIDAGYTPARCYAKAWNAIKHRVGLEINGKFVKWDNLTQAQRIKVAQSGQLSDPDTDLTHCKSFCSAEEWTEIIRCKA